MPGEPFAQPIALVAGATQVVLAKGPGFYKGIHVRETGGVALTLQLFDNGSAAAGTIVQTVVLAANGTYDVYFADNGIALSNGLFINRAAGGSFEGSVRLG